MSRKHFIALAEAISRISNPQERKSAADAVADVCASSNSNFNRARFLKRLRRQVRATGQQQGVTTMNIGEMDIESAAKVARGNWLKFECFGWHDQPDDSEEWAIIYTHNRDSGLLDQSNADAVGKALAPFMEEETADVLEEHHGHWACGWVDGYAIRVYRDGQITEAFRAYHELAARLADYPVLDEEDYSRREYEATLENLRSEGFDSDYFAPPDGWESEVYTWLWDNDQSAIESHDDNGGYASAYEIGVALAAIGYRITWLVTYNDSGEVCEEFDEEWQAQERCEELRAAGVYATYDDVTPEPARD